VVYSVSFQGEMRKTVETPCEVFGLQIENWEELEPLHYTTTVGIYGSDSGLPERHELQTTSLPRFLYMYLPHTIEILILWKC
jgi:hypothetical protein